MATVGYEIERNDHLAEFGPICDSEAAAAIGEANKVRVAAVKREAPKDRGTYQASIKSRVRREGSLTIGETFSDDDAGKVNVIENGLAPGTFPMLSNLQDWAGRKGIPRFLIGRAIKRKGIRGRHVFERAELESDPEADRILGEQLTENIVARL